VERILSMVDGAIVLVDASEGPMPQTKFVVGKALKVGLRPIVAINKIDRPDARADEEVVNEVFDLFAALDATDEQLDFPILYGSGRAGWMNCLAGRPAGWPRRRFSISCWSMCRSRAVGEEDGAFRMIGTLLEANPFLGRIITGRIHSGSIKPNQAVKVLSADGKTVETGRISKILAFRGIERHADRGSESRRHRRHRGPVEGYRRGHLLRSVGDRAAARTADRSADGHDVLHRQRQPAGRHRRRQGHFARDPRSPAQGSRGQCRA
jgi:predicted membrane GTPase involved in stress response